MSEELERKINTLTEEEIEYVRKKFHQEQAMSAWALKVRGWITFVVILVGAFTLLWDQFKGLVKAAAS